MKRDTKYLINLLNEVIKTAEDKEIAISEYNKQCLIEHVPFIFSNLEYEEVAKDDDYKKAMWIMLIKAHEYKTIKSSNEFYTSMMKALLPRKNLKASKNYHIKRAIKSAENLLAFMGGVVTFAETKEKIEKIKQFKEALREIKSNPKAFMCENPRIMKKDEIRKILNSLTIVDVKVEVKFLKGKSQHIKNFIECL